MKRLMIKTLVAAAAVAAFGLASAQDVREHTIKFATQNPKGHPIMVGMEKFAEIVTAKSGGKISMDVVTRGVMPFMLAQFAIMFLMVLFPQLVMVPARWFY